MNKKLILAFVVAGLFGCEDDPGTILQDNIDTTPPQLAIFNPSASEIPFPSNILMGTDGTLNIPVADATDVTDPAVSMNALDGFSTIAPITTTFSSAINAATIPGNVRVFELTTNASLIATGFVRELTMFNGTSGEFVATVSGQTTLAISPIAPLKEKTTYAVVIGSGLQNTDGVPFSPDTTYALSKQATSLLNGASSAVPALSDAQALALEPWRMMTNAAETQIAANASPAIAANQIIFSWTFTTQSIGDVLANERTDINTNFTPTIGSFTAAGSSPGTLANIYASTISVPYYLDAASSANDPTPLTSHWVGASNSTLTRYNTNAASRSTQTIPLLVTIPSGMSKPVSGWPVVIFQHGITGSRTNMLGVADSLAQAGYAVVAIDLPLHGGRTFNLDLVTQNSSGAITAAVPDGVADSSGRHFIQLASLLTSRDNVRQAVTDLFTLTKGIGLMDIDGGGADFDTTNIYFVGHSLGAMVGTPFLALEPNVKDAVLGMPGGGIAKVLDGSATFGPEISAGLAANGVTKGTTDYESFMLAAQTVMDTVDPVNFANGTMGQTDGSAGAISNRGLLMFEVVGDSVTGSPSDLVIPNTVPDGNDTTGTVASPLSGTNPLATMMGLTQASADTTGSNLHGIVKFTAGHHSSILTPSNISGSSSVLYSTETFTEMQTIMATFIATDGATINITDTCNCTVQ